MSIELRMCAKRVDELTAQNAELLDVLKVLLEDIKFKHHIHTDALVGASTRDALLKASAAIAKAEGGA